MSACASSVCVLWMRFSIFSTEGWKKVLCSLESWCGEKCEVIEGRRRGAYKFVPILCSGMYQSSMAYVGDVGLFWTTVRFTRRFRIVSAINHLESNVSMPSRCETSAETPWWGI